MCWNLSVGVPCMEASVVWTTEIDSFAVPLPVWQVLASVMDILRIYNKSGQLRIQPWSQGNTSRETRANQVIGNKNNKTKPTQQQEEKKKNEQRKTFPLEKKHTTHKQQKLRPSFFSWIQPNKPEEPCLSPITMLDQNHNTKSNTRPVRS